MAVRVVDDLVQDQFRPTTPWIADITGLWI
jgi:hypothetical protein